ncbi:MAG: ABC transporter permease [Candidatus Promineifilaceae bacterium]
MKALDIALKDMRQSFRSKGAIIFMFVIPILITVLFYFMFGRIAGGEDSFEVPQTVVALANLDEGEAPGIGSMGAFLADVLRGEDLGDLVKVTEMSSAAAARTAVDNQEAGIAVIIPAGFSDALAGQGEPAEVELYSDPTLTIGPAIVSSIVGQIVDGMASTTIGVGVTIERLEAANAEITPEIVQEIIDSYTVAASPQQSSALTRMQAPPGADSGSGGEMAELLAYILGGMMVFYAFFTGANVLNTILTEQENGTLQRLFTTPTSHLTLFSGKFIAALIILTVQIAVLLLFGYLVFHIEWGDPLPVVIAAAGLVIIAATTGLFLVSLLKDTRQGGIIFGGLLTLTGMVGLFTVFTVGSPNTPQALDTVSLLVPQGWAMRPFRQAIEGDALPNIALTFAVILLWSAVFFFVGQYRLRKRFD